MQFILSFTQSQLFSLFLLLVNLIFLVCLFLQNARIKRLQQRLRKLFANSNGDNLETTLNRLFEQIDDCKKKQDDQQFVMNRLSQKMSSTSGNLAVMRYNAFGDVGSDLSFSLALIDDQQNGVVITSIYGREESRIYAKPIENGTSAYHLTEEELAVVKKASSLI